MGNQDTVKATIRNFISSRTQSDDFRDDVNLVKTGLVNSLFSVELMTFLEKAFSIKIGMNDLDMSHFQSVDAMETLVNRKRAR